MRRVASRSPLRAHSTKRVTKNEHTCCSDTVERLDPGLRRRWLRYLVGTHRINSSELGNSPVKTRQYHGTHSDSTQLRSACWTMCKTCVFLILISFISYPLLTYAAYSSFLRLLVFTPVQNRIDVRTDLTRKASEWFTGVDGKSWFKASQMKLSFIFVKVNVDEGLRSLLAKL